MKNIFLVILFTSALYAQPYYTFTDLRGMEDSSGVTHLFYGTNLRTVGELSYLDDYDIYHYNTSNSVDTVFFQSGSYDHKYFGGNFSFISDFTFWDNNPSLYISCGGQGSDEAGPFVQRFDDELPNFMPSFGSVDNIEISKQNDSLVYTGGTELFKSTDGGRSWEIVQDNTGFISLSPYDDRTIYFSENQELKKSTDGGVTYSSCGITDNFYDMIFDADSIHIYALIGNRLYVSDNSGNTGSWSVPYSSDRAFYLAHDSTASGLLYLADGNKIFVSVDHGKTFNLFKELDRKILGLYKKPGTSVLYAITKYKLYKIDDNEITVLKELQLNPDLLNHYPLAVGNKWIYRKDLRYEDFTSVVKLYTREIVGDTITANGMVYFIIKDNEERVPEYYFERVDSVLGIIFRYNPMDSLEYSLENLMAESGDTLFSGRYDASQIACLGNNSSNWEYHPSIEFEEMNVLAARKYKLVYGLGIDNIEYSFDEGHGYIDLKGAVINGVVFGDTLLADIKDDNPKLPEYNLSQNYPNPFNPVTNISYSIKSRGNVTLKIYDILGKEVATLVNEEEQPGNYEVTFNGSSLASGVYIYRLTTGTFSQSKKLLLMK